MTPSMLSASPLTTEDTITRADAPPIAPASRRSVALTNSESALRVLSIFTPRRFA